MTDRRLTPFNGRAAHVSLQGRVAADRFVAGEPMQVTALLADLLSRPGVRERQLLFGEGFLVLDREGAFAFGRSDRDGYVGWLLASALGPVEPTTHWVAAPSTHAYPGPSIRAKELGLLSLGARLAVAGNAGAGQAGAGQAGVGAERFAVTTGGWHVPVTALRAIGDWQADPVAVAESLLGTPYLWGGNSRSGIDCSGLVQAACLACGLPCPADSDQQRDSLGTPLDAGAALCRGDLLFWAGHVAFVADGARILHANAHTMSVAFEPLAEALARIAGGGTPLLARRRLTV